MNLIDSDILTRCREGDKSAFRVIVQQYQRMLFSLALKLLGDEEEAKDAVQEAFIKVWLNIRNYDPQRDFTTCINTIASRLCLDRLRRTHLMQPLPEDERVLQDFCTHSSPQSHLENKDWVSIVRLLASGLSDKQRLVFTLSALEGLDNKEIELITGLDASQVKNNLYLSRKTIREQLKLLGYE